MPGIWEGILGGYETHRKTQAEREAEIGRTSREKANLILKAILEGTIEPTEEPKEAIIRGLKGEGYKRVAEKPGKYQPTTQKEALGFERAKAGVKERGARRTEARKALGAVTGKAAERGFALQTEPTLGPQEQLKAAYQLIAGEPRMREEEKPKEPSWQQQQTDASIRTGLNRGIGLVAKGPFGELEQMPIKSYADAVTFLQYSKRDPAQFQKELQFYKDIVQVGMTDDGRTFAKMRDGRVIDLATREEVSPETLIER